MFISFFFASKTKLLTLTIHITMKFISQYKNLIYLSDNPDIDFNKVLSFIKNNFASDIIQKKNQKLY